ncbi:putative hydrolase or acyltransferase [Deinococcus deserti VCD115]|uniref:Putative hydrolase or acyltransferase n=2 Tax=Deinococcus TaxID=1298 RepID=C1CV48_DEIDV|nr:putative hydrolase or acyltransferase [Deinococcus deserti VCD115]
MQMQTFQAAQATLHVQKTGDGPPVVLIHGLSGSSRWWRRNIPALSREHQVFVLDLVGYGRAWRQRALSVQAASQLIADWLETEDLSDVTLIGHSMGGHIALRAAALAPERVDRLVLACASGLLKTSPTRAALKLPHAMMVGRPSFVPRIMADALRAGPLNLWHGASDLLRDSVHDLLPQISARTLVIWGARDVLVPVALGRTLAAAIPGAEYHEIPRAGHVVMVDAPETFNRLVLSFMKESEAV